MSILDWNAVALEVSRRDFTPGSTGDLDNTGAIAPEQGGPTRTSRALAIIHIAMHDAVATISGLTTYSNGHGITLPALPANADVLGAIAGAASATLQALWKAEPQTEFVQEKLQEARNRAEASGVAFDAFETGMHFGAAVGRAILAARANDGHSALDDMCFSELPYRHRADPYNPSQGRLSVYWGEVQPFCIDPAAAGERIDTRYLDAYPKVNTQANRYKAAVLDVKSLGAAFGSTRTADETVNGIFWGYDGPPGLGVPPRLYNQVVLKAIDAHCPGIGDPELASLLAMVNVGMADAAIVAWSAKYHYDLWRPVVGIREHDLGFGPSHRDSAGVANPQYCDPSWAPLGAPRTNVTPGQFHRTPDFPAYPSGHATFGAVAFRLTALFIATKRGLATTREGMDLKVTFTSDEYNGRSKGPHGEKRPIHNRTFSLRDAIIDNALSRVHLGVHWRFDGLGAVAPDDLDGAILTDPASPNSLGEAAEKRLGGVPAGLQIAKEIYESNCFALPAAPVVAAVGKKGKTAKA